jgi:NDP-sugar pyrophosphorylase family protein
MSGFGKRFQRAGYSVPKPLINIDGKPIISYVIEMFPREVDFLFICNENHLANKGYKMRETLSRYCPTGRVIGIKEHNLGPVHAVREVYDFINLDQPIVVNYCDFSCFWDWTHFLHFVEITNCAGCIPAYRGFHPHSLGNTNYAYLREADGWVHDIREKQPFTNDRIEEYASSGTYYFSSGRVMKGAFDRVIEQDLSVGGEFYVSLAYKPLLESNHPIAVYPLQHFMQWGTPEDVAEYIEWSNLFRRLLGPFETQNAQVGALIVPMAGMGKRFSDEGYSLSKPLIPVSGRPMVLQAVQDLPLAKQHVFVLRSDMPGHKKVTGLIKDAYPEAVIESVPELTDGQACTSLIGLDALEQRIGAVAEPITICACDNGVLYSNAALWQLVGDPEVDVIIWGVRGHTNAIRHPNMFGWIDAAHDGRITRISVKTPLNAPKSDPVVIGTFTFKRASDFRNAISRLVARDGRINGEFYIDACINDALAMGLRCHLFEVDHFVSWGTPNDLRTFEYWQSCFHKWDSHGYTLARDMRILPGAGCDLATRYHKILPIAPGRGQCNDQT